MIFNRLGVARSTSRAFQLDRSRERRRNLHVGLIGLGRIGKVHLQGLKQTGAIVEIMSTPRSLELEPLANQYGVGKWTRDASEVLSDPKVDAVVVCSPTPRHAEQIIEAAGNKKHIFCEKPIDLSLDVVDKAIAAVEEAGVKLMVGFNRRFDANFKRVERSVASGEVGDVKMVRITSRDPSPPPMSYIETSGGLFRDMTIHDFDMARFLVKDEVEEVFAMGQCRDPAIQEAGDIDSAVCVLRFRNGVLCYIENSREAAYGYDQRVEVLGTLGSVSCDNKYGNDVMVSTAESVRRDVPLYFFLERYMEAYVSEMEAFVQMCATDCANPASGLDGRAALVLALAASKSLKENRPVKVSEME